MARLDSTIGLSYRSTNSLPARRGPCARGTAPQLAPVAAEAADAAAFPGVAVWWSATRADRGRDDSCDRVRVGDQCQVRSAVERGDVRACTLGHRELRGGRDDLLAGADEVPGWDGHPSRCL